MANTDKVTDFDDPFQVADLAKREGAEGLLRLADYFESMGQQTPTTVRTALAMSRGPGVFPAAGAFLQKAKPSAARENVPQEGVPEALRPSSPSDWVTARPMVSGLSQPRTNGRPLEKLGVVPEPAMGQAPSYTLEDLPVQDYPRAPVAPLYELEDVAQGPTPEAIAKIAKRNVSLTSPIPTASASPTKDAAAPVTSVVPSTGPQSPAGKPESMGTPGLPAPSSDGAGGDASERDLYLARLAAQSAAGFGGMGAGKSIDMGIADTLGERLKQVQALRAKREERALELAREDEQSAALVSQYKSLAAQGLVPELPGLDRLPFKQAASLIKTYGSLPGLVQRTEKTKAEIPLVQARTGTEERKPEQKDTQLKETERHNRAMEAAAWAAANRAARGAAEERGIKPETLSNRLKDLNAQTKPFQEIVSSLKEADAALSALGTGQISRGAKIASKIPLVGSSFVSTPELRAMQGQEGLKQSYQKLKTGLAAVGQELTSFENQFGLNWYADPRKAPLAVESLKQITQDALRRTQAPFGAGTGNAALDQMEVLSLLKNTGGLTADNPIFRPNPKLERAAGVISGPAGPTESQIAKLKARPDMAADFDKKFGPGAAAKILGGP